MSEPISLLIVEDHQLIRCGLRLIFEEQPGFTMIAEASDGKAAVETALKLKPLLILMDIGLPELNGIEATQQIKAALPETRVIMLTSHDRDADVFAALSAGADGYCLKDIPRDQLVIAAQTVASGVGWLAPAIAKRVLKSVSAPRTQEQQQDRSPFALSTRELEVLEQIVLGLGNQQIAEKLTVSAETVKTHVRHILEKLCVSDRTQAAVKALKQGIIG